MSYGDYKVFESILVVLGPVLVLGGKDAANIFIPNYIKAHKEHKAWAYILFFGMIGLGMLTLSILLVTLVTHQYDNHTLHYLFVFPIGSLLFLSIQVINAAGRKYLSSLFSSILIPLLLLICLVLSNQYHPMLHIKFIFMLYAIILSALLLCTSVIIFRTLPKRFHHALEHIEPKAWVIAATPVFLAMFISNLLIQQDLFLMEILGKYEAEVGILGVCLTISSIIWFVFRAQCFWFSPQVAIATEQNDAEQLQKILQRYNVSVIYFGGIVSALIIPFSHNILLYFNPELAPYHALLSLLVFFFWIASFFSSANLILMISEHRKIVMKISVWVLLLSLILEVILIPFFDIWGAVIPLILGRLALSFSAVYFCKQYYPISFLRL